MSRIFASRIEWIRTHTFHNPEDECELVFRSLPNFVKCDIFNQYMLGGSASKIIHNIQGNMAGLSQRVNNQVYPYVHLFDNIKLT